MIPFSVRASKPGLFMKKYFNRSLILPLLSLGDMFGSSNVTPLSKLLAAKERFMSYFLPTTYVAQENPPA